MDSRGVISWIAVLLILSVSMSGCLLSGSDQEEQEIIDAEDEFIKEYLREQMEKDNQAAAEKQDDIGEKSIKEEKPAKKKRVNAEPTTTTSSTVKALEECPYECCNGVEYLVKECGRWFACVNFTCTDIPCPYECCVLGMYEWKECPNGIECVNYTCNREPCPRDYECCNGSTHQVRSCEEGFYCVGQRCVSEDSDGDGLADVVEDNYGTNAAKRDTDGDGLSDYHEVRVSGSDPTDENTDDDRYDDGADPHPRTIDTADINVSVFDVKVTVNGSLQLALANYLDFNLTIPSNDTEVARIESNVRVENNGTDYTGYLRYNYTIRYWCGQGIDVRRKPFIIDQYHGNTTNTSYSVGVRANFTGLNQSSVWEIKRVYVNRDERIDPGTRYTTHMRNTIVFSDLANTTYAAIASRRRCYYNITVEDVKYESY
ncbi:MAG: hypothetical protein GF416_08520 [Candidatus Altiarchaeales archaeon]|nr:hypothetical protein [Candidatus Altiarchaeales archaeon]MBD3417159.1 hypothetical protein [Candidatus Altiarchaeales archaeon]